MLLSMSKLPMAYIIKSNDYRILSTQNQDLYLFIIHYPTDYLATLNKLHHKCILGKLWRHPKVFLQHSVLTFKPNNNIFNFLSTYTASRSLFVYNSLSYRLLGYTKINCTTNAY